MSATDPMVSVVIPVRNREVTIERAVRSALGQTISPLEVIVVDDGSSDASAEIVRAIRDERVKLVTNNVSGGGARARNIGIRNACGTIVAFLDSDDEWLDMHLSTALSRLATSHADGCFSSFYTISGRGQRLFRCGPVEAASSMASYILSAGFGDTRTSTFVFRADRLRDIMFDETLDKHQDWDLAIRFASKYRMVSVPTATAVLHLDERNRMSYRLDHSATSEFLRRYENSVDYRTRARIYINLAFRTLMVESRSAHFYRYMSLALGFVRSASLRDASLLHAMRIPMLDRVYRPLIDLVSLLRYR